MVEETEMDLSNYETFFNLRAKPFELVPNPEFLFLSKTHRKAMTYLEYGITEKAGFILLTGEVGSGKTTLIRNLIKKLDDTVALSKVFNTRVNSEQLISLINDDFGLDVQGRNKAVLLKDLYDFLIDRYARGQHAVLIIDEAQNLDAELLEEVRMLSNLETDNAKLLQIILVGQPELKKLLSTPALRQLRQRINVSCHLYHLQRGETEEYILHRLEVAGNREAVVFSKEALDVVFEYSRGVPRLINIICDFVMLSAFIDKTHEAGELLVREIIKDLEIDNRYWDFEKEDEIRPAVIEEDALQGGSVNAGQLKILLEEVCGRLEDLEKRASVHNISAPRELEKRIERVEKFLAMKFKDNPPVPAVAGEKLPEKAEPYDLTIRYADKLEYKKFKKGLFGRIFGS